MSLFDDSDQLLARPKYETSFRIFYVALACNLDMIFTMD